MFYTWKIFETMQITMIAQASFKVKSSLLKKMLQYFDPKYCS